MQNQQRGISIVELMVALIISSLLILGISQIYLDNRNNVLFQQNQGNNIENNRFAILIIQEAIYKSGFRREPSLPMDENFESTPLDNRCDSWLPGSVIKIMGDNDICIRYQVAFPNSRSCEGNALPNPPNDPYQRRNDLQVVERYTLNNGVLTCNGMELATNIDTIEWIYGTNSTEEKEVTQYTSNPAADDIIRALEFSILSASTNQVSRNSISPVFEFFHDSPPNDRRLYNMLSTSTSLRNLMP